MFKILGEFLHTGMTKISRCQLCSMDLQHSHTLCDDCWHSLPWYKNKIIKNDREINIACYYQFPIDRIIQKYKYENQLQYQTLLAHCLMNLRLPKVHAIVPMPISKERLIERGYNQMLIIAKIMSRQHKIPVWQPVIRSAQHSQKGLNRLERIENIEEQFQMIHNQNKPYKKVLIIDDVITTGASIGALAQALEGLGCSQIYTACIASGAITKSNEI
ncbi:phosphoribosyltransferase family protein [Acinetobacter gerneri]|uniref:ComF family protein n=1 Tax=Acinetobacter gerneri TaxID=202952 RepID=UPI002935A870|nr:phosphoribosyltransferase family protein [Acinetobacter gerneri]MDV2439610.1 phosphoribosyltransferase family protein [Acinetobacter gerneri]